MSEDKPFLRRWSLRKAAHRAGQPVDDKEKPETKALAPAAEKNVADDSPPPKDLPSIESLTADSDYSRFLKADVPGPLRKAALRKLWTSDPVFSSMDILDLHNLDYTFPKIPEVVTSLFQVGRGMVLPEDEAPKKEADKIEGQPVAEAPALPAASPEAPVDTKLAEAQGDKAAS
jgi:Protein of unknown function (DUF3306)